MSTEDGIVSLEFGEGKHLLAGGKDIRESLSAVATSGEATLFVACDESQRIERLTRAGAGRYAGHEVFDLAALLDGLPLTDEEEEVDVEGLWVDAGHLWVVGSHSAKRKAAKPPKPGDDPKESAKKNRKRLADVEVKGNRYLLARIPLGGTDDLPTLERGGARLEGDEWGNALTAALASDAQLRYAVPRKPRTGPDGSLLPVEAVPGKENGFDIEGLAVAGDRIFVGLRGPVLRGWSVVLELRCRVDGSHLRLEPIGPDGEPYLKHLLDLDGLGVRDLCVDGRDLLVLAGPTMTLRGAVGVYRWRKALDATGPAFVWRDELELVLDLPSRPAPAGAPKGSPPMCDNAEGITLVSDAEGRPALLVVYDSPAPDRLRDPATITAGLKTI